MSGSGDPLRGGAPNPERVVTVLTVSDAGEDRDSLRTILNHSNWTIHEALGCGEAATALRRHRVAVVLCDDTLPDGNWKRVLRELETASEAPLLIVTARNADDRLWAEVLNEGAYDLIPKPYDRKEVIRVVSTAWLHWKDTQCGLHPLAAGRPGGG